MLKLVIVLGLSGIALSAISDSRANILRHRFNVNPDNSYFYVYETDNGIRATEEGKLKQIGNDVGLVAEGAFQYISPEGQQISLTYIADENGFQPVGSHLPTPPPIPEAIRRALEWNAAHPEEDNY